LPIVRRGVTPSQPDQLDNDSFDVEVLPRQLGQRRLDSSDVVVGHTASDAKDLFHPSAVVEVKKYAALAVTELGIHLGGPGGRRGLLPRIDGEWSGETVGQRVIGVERNARGDGDAEATSKRRRSDVERCG
jgi:hypothetical protein